MVPDRSSPSRVRCAASRPGPLRADPKGWLFMREKGGKSFFCYLPLPARSAAVCLKSFVLSSLPIRKVLVLPFAGALAPLLVGFSFVFSELSTAVVATTTCFFTTCSLLLVSSDPKCRRYLQVRVGDPFGRVRNGVGDPKWTWIDCPRIHSESVDNAKNAALRSASKRALQVCW